MICRTDIANLKTDILEKVGQKIIVKGSLGRSRAFEKEATIEKAYPRFKHEQHVNKAEYRNVDRLQNPNRELLKIIPEYSNREYLPKLEAAEYISPYLSLENNNSESFNQTITAILKLVS